MTRRALLHTDTPLAPFTRFGVGGRAALFAKPASIAELADILDRVEGERIVPIGLGSNLLVRDGGLRGLAVRLTGEFRRVGHNEGLILAGGGASNRAVVDLAQQHGLGGLEFLSGIPGTIGGSVRMNAGCFGREVGDILVWARVMLPTGQLHRLVPADLRFGYREAHLPEGAIVVDCALATRPERPEAIAATLAAIARDKTAYQPVAGRTCGSTFRNPAGQHARHLIAGAGCAGLRVGGAQVSTQNPNFLFNRGDASASDIEALIDRVQTAVLERYGIALTLELHIVGETGPPNIATRCKLNQTHFAEKGSRHVRCI